MAAVDRGDDSVDERNQMKDDCDATWGELSQSYKEIQTLENERDALKRQVEESQLQIGFLNEVIQAQSLPNFGKQFVKLKRDNHQLRAENAELRKMLVQQITKGKS